MRATQAAKKINPASLVCAAPGRARPLVLKAAMTAAPPPVALVALVLLAALATLSGERDDGGERGVEA